MLYLDELKTKPNTLISDVMTLYTPNSWIRENLNLGLLLAEKVSIDQKKKRPSDRRYMLIVFEEITNIAHY